jgi:prepilin-type N-terminal cleavage/methylation domain-containing protein
MRISRTAIRGERSAFTLIELLIVVAIIAILAAIAVPNFLEAQSRSKIARSKADMRSLGTAIESYCVDNNRPPVGGYEDNVSWFETRGWMYAMTTPIAYMSSAPTDVFAPRVVGSEGPSSNTPRYFKYDQFIVDKRLDGDTNVSNTVKNLRGTGVSWELHSWGPSRRSRPYGFTSNSGGGPVIGVSMKRALLYDLTTSSSIRHPDIWYDPSNGTMSYGYICRSSRGIEPTM